MIHNESSAKSTINGELAIIPNEIHQGDAILVRSQTEQSITWNGIDYSLAPYRNGYYALLPVHTDMKPGTYHIAGHALTVLKKSFETQQLKVTEQQAAMLQNLEGLAQDQKKIDAARSVSEPTFLFDGPFSQPIIGRLTTPYGFTRYINGALNGNRHNAIDLAAPEGTEIKATNSGKIVLAEELFLRGNAIYIDHGMGLFSEYAHLSKSFVQSGDMVEAEQIIGLVGNTGFSTGPHLHFAFWIHNVQSNPFHFFESSPFYWEDNNNL